MKSEFLPNYFPASPESFIWFYSLTTRRKHSTSTFSGIQEFLSPYSGKKPYLAMVYGHFANHTESWGSYQMVSFVALSLSFSCQFDRRENHLGDGNLDVPVIIDV